MGGRDGSSEGVWEEWCVGGRVRGMVGGRDDEREGGSYAAGRAGEKEGRREVRREGGKDD